MQKIIECVPNFSEGKSKSIIDEILSEIKSESQVELLDSDMGADTNRTVVTFVGSPENVINAAFKAISKASQIIDMSKHHGTHSRIGATDVCPIIPVKNVTMEECVEFAKRLGERVGNELKIPVYLYEKAATSPDRVNLATIRAGEYEGLEQKLKDPKWKPDYGEPIFNPRAGATIIAYNVNLNTKDLAIGRDIIFDLREYGRAKRDDKGEIIRDDNGKALTIPGRLKAVKGGVWYVEKYQRCQITMNLVNFHITSMHQAVDEIEIEAHKRGCRVTGSEIIGVVPLEAILEAGLHYLKKQGKSQGVSEEDIVECAIQSLGLSDVVPFDPKEKIIEYKLAQSKSGNQWMNKPIRTFMNDLSSDSFLGGGSVSALLGALSSSLFTMVANLTVGKKGYEKNWEKMNEIAIQGQKFKDWFLEQIDEDISAFNQVISSRRLPQKTDSEKEKRKKEVEQATKNAVLVPFSVLKKASEIVDFIAVALENGNVNALSDCGVSAMCLYSASWGVYYNILINIQYIDDSVWVNDIKPQADDLLKSLEEKVFKIQKDCKTKLEKKEN
ncbi:formimidoyltransferase-cyclodeaminase [Anaeramoeba ignava]|uniref:Formimidoyltransferase-cyclodeaminase n=1 Tax=Anaeramoeba ignava TaxID=1746090 RepID=A0A9Q0LTI7_ANAIG|nr:formimidoyltransferase-cyclodeaminase [Anaeramoeba ignava]